MARTHSHYTNVRGQNIGWGLSKRGDNGIWFVLFKGPHGKARITTGKRDEKAALIEAPNIINEFFSPLPTPKKGHKKEPATATSWLDFIEIVRGKLCDNNSTNKTFTSYRSSIRNVAAMLPHTFGPADVTPELAEEFKAVYSNTKFTKSNAEGATEYTRSKNSVITNLAQLRAVWGECWAGPNPWQAVKRPKPEHADGPHCPPEAHFTKFFTWLRAKYPKWDLPVAFFLVKSVCGCRLSDLCSLRADQFDGTRIDFDANQTKNKAPRMFLLREDVAALVRKVKGKEFLWDAYPDQFIAFLNANKRRSGLCKPTFDPITLASFVSNVMKEWQAEHPKEEALSSHDFRKRAVTLSYQAGMSISEIADLFSMTEQNVVKSYLDKSAKAVPDALFVKASAALLPPVL